MGDPSLRPVHILGFNSTHDASAALVRDGEIVCAIEEERLTRQKHHYGFPEKAVAACLSSAGIGMADLDHVAFYWNAREGRLPFLFHVLRRFPKSLAYFDHQPGIYRRFRGLPKLLREMGFRGRFHFLSHHRNHIASSFFPSGFSEAAAISVDGTGEWATTVLAHVHPGGRTEVLQRSCYPHSIGKLWEALTQHLGFKPNSGEGKVMGLAPYGRPRYVEDFRELLTLRPDGRIRLDLRYFDFHYGRKRKYSDRFLARFGPPREPESRIEERHEDLAYALQAVTEEMMLGLARFLHGRTGLTRLVLSGGVALNSVANGRLVRETPFRDVFVQPGASDAGAALGAALRVWHEVLGHGEEGRHRMDHCYLGPEFAEADAEAAIRASGLAFRRSADAPAEAAERLARGEIVGWCRGRMEYGPRSLGNRSILADPRPADVKDRLNARVKHREGFRPFAPSVPLEDAQTYFETGGIESPYMLLVFPVREAKRALLPGITHVDGTARLQTVRREQNPAYYDLLKRFGERTGVPVLLNTSFNVRGEPIVMTPSDALACYLGTELDALFLGDLVVAKRS